MSRIGIITYHSAYNYGSVLQALATQNVVDVLGHQAHIINYRMNSQKDFYSLYRKKYGLKTFIKDVMLFPYQRERVVKAKKFEKVISRMNLTEELIEPDDVYKIDRLFDCFISGSDQIWNKHSCELTPVGWEYMDPYLLKFTNKKKISYASSVASMTDEELERILPDIEKFDYISFREDYSARKISNMLGRKIACVLDPTLLLTQDKWDEIFNFKCEFYGKKYIFFYSLAGYKDVKPFIKSLSGIATKFGVEVYAITPFLYFRDTGNIHFVYDAGPEDFLKYIWNAELIVTDSYHGTLFSINFKKTFYSITNGLASHMRKNQVLELLGMTDRIITKADDILFAKEVIPYDRVYEIVNDQKQISITYLRNAIGD